MLDLLKKISISNCRVVALTLFVLTATLYFIPVHPAQAEDSPPIPKLDYGNFNGTWQRTDGNYLIKVSDVHEDGRATVEYFNPQPIHVTEAAISTQKEFIKLSVKLQDKNYEGSTYTLYYYTEKDALAGFYYHATMDKTYKVIFLRKTR